jgi:hypothetical protein
MMRPTAIVTAFLGSLAVCSASILDKKLMESPKFLEEIKRTVMLKPKGSRKLEDANVSSYTAIWYFLHEGDCLETEEPTVSLKCTNGGNATVTAVSEYPSCDEVSDAEWLCTTESTNSTGHAVDFTCSGDTLEDTVASATILEQTSDCLGGSDTRANWGRGILLGLTCGDEIGAHNGTCDPLNSTFPDNTCTIGFECDSICTDTNYTIEDITSFITDNDCNEKTVGTSGSSNVVIVLSTVFAAAMTIFFW